jgi:hypothetical protein
MPSSSNSFTSPSPKSNAGSSKKIESLSRLCTSVENPQLLLDDRHCVRALLDAPRHLAELVPDVRAPQGAGSCPWPRTRMRWWSWWCHGRKRKQQRGGTSGRVEQGLNEDHPEQLIVEVHVPMVSHHRLGEDYRCAHTAALGAFPLTTITGSRSSTLGATATSAPSAAALSPKEWCSDGATPIALHADIGVVLRGAACYAIASMNR